MCNREVCNIASNKACRVQRPNNNEKPAEHTEPREHPENTQSPQSPSRAGAVLGSARPLRHCLSMKLGCSVAQHQVQFRHGELCIQEVCGDGRVTEDVPGRPILQSHGDEVQGWVFVKKFLVRTWQASSNHLTASCSDKCLDTQEASTHPSDHVRQILGQQLFVPVHGPQTTEVVDAELAVLMRPHGKKTDFDPR